MKNTIPARIKSVGYKVNEYGEICYTAIMCIECKPHELETVPISQAMHRRIAQGGKPVLATLTIEINEEQKQK